MILKTVLFLYAALFVVSLMMDHGPKTILN